MGTAEVMIRETKMRIALLLLVTTFLSACAQEVSGQPNRVTPVEPWTGVMADVNAVWSAEPGTDLLSNPAVVVRAYVESHALATAMGTIDAVYPGFTRAVTRPAEPEDDPDSAWPGADRPLPYPLVGTERLHILRVDTVGRAVTAIVCSYGGYTNGYDLGNGKYGPYPGVAGDDGVVAMQISMMSPEVPSAPLPPQQGQERAPKADVFGGWRINSRRLDLNRFQPEWPTALDDIQACRERAPDPLQRREFLSQGEHPRSDYPTLPAYPGWPAAPSS
jgi:hypothetical protein